MTIVQLQQGDNLLPEKKTNTQRTMGLGGFAWRRHCRKHRGKRIVRGLVNASTKRLTNGLYARLD